MPTTVAEVRTVGGERAAQARLALHQQRLHAGAAVACTALAGGLGGGSARSSCGGAERLAGVASARSAPAHPRFACPCVGTLCQGTLALCQGTLALTRLLP
eukprot:7767967-Pyramimonas_sp.AAC.1